MKKFLMTLTVPLLALLGTLALLWVNTDVATSTCFLFFVRDVLATLAGKEALAALLVIALAALYARTVNQPFAWRRFDRLKLGLLSAFFALVATLGAAYRGEDAQLAYFLTGYHVLFLAAKFAGFFSLFYLCMKALLLRLPQLAQRFTPAAVPARKAQLRAFWLTWAIIACTWIPSVVARFPGAVAADVGRALQQYYGEVMLTSDHPLGYTYLVGSVIKLGSMLGSDNFGVFLCTLLQWLSLSGVMAYSTRLLQREGFPPVVRHGLTALYALLPLSMFNAAAIIKDIPYATAFLAYTLCCAHALLHPAEAAKAWRWWTGYVFLSLLVLLLRHNGVMAVVPATAVLLVRFARSTAIGHRARYGLLVLPLAVLLLFNTLVVPRVAYPVESAADTLGVAIQQTARILRDSPEAASASDMAVIDKVLVANQLGSAYNPKVSDAVRKLYRYHDAHTAGDVARFAGVWAKLAAREPLTAFHAFWSLSGGFVDPFDTASRFWATMVDPQSSQYPVHLTIEHPPAMQSLQNRLVSLESSYMALPLVSQLNSVGLYAWALFVGWFLVSRTRERRLAWLLVLPMMTLLACLLSSGFVSGTRYALPIVYVAPYLLCLFLRPALAESLTLPADAAV